MILHSINVEEKKVNTWPQFRLIWSMPSKKCPLLTWNNANLGFIYLFVCLGFNFQNKENCCPLLCILILKQPFFPQWDRFFLILGFIIEIIPKCSHKTHFSGSLNPFKVNFLLTCWFSIQEVKENESQWLFRFAEFTDVFDRRVNLREIKESHRTAENKNTQVWC